MKFKLSETRKTQLVYLSISITCVLWIWLLVEIIRGFAAIF